MPVNIYGYSVLTIEEMISLLKHAVDSGAVPKDSPVWVRGERLFKPVNDISIEIKRGNSEVYIGTPYG